MRSLWSRSGRELTLRQAILSSMALLVAMTVLSAGVTTWERLQVEDVRAELRERLRPAQTAVADLTRAYVDQESGQRGYALTRLDTFLQPYERGREESDRLQQQLTGLLDTDPTATALLASAAEAGRTWQQEVAEPELAARRQGPMSTADTEAFALRGKELFDGLRQRLGDVASRVSQLTQDRLAQVAAAQELANVATTLAALLAVTVGVGTAFALARRTTRPLSRLVDELAAVAAGDRSRPITVAGPSEVRTIAAAAETMRSALVASSAALAVAERRVGTADERERMARQVGDLTLHRLYGLTLGMSQLSSSHPQLAAEVRPLVEQTDTIAQELRGIIYPLPEDVEPAGGSAS